jgi:PIN domain nuclease of toxin-antitoxin system
MMIAQAQVEGMTFVTRDAHALAYPVRTLLG